MYCGELDDEIGRRGRLARCRCVKLAAGAAWCCWARMTLGTRICQLPSSPSTIRPSSRAFIFPFTSSQHSPSPSLTSTHPSPNPSLINTASGLCQTSLPSHPSSFPDHDITSASLYTSPQQVLQTDHHPTTTTMAGTQQQSSQYPNLNPNAIVNS